MNMDDRVWNQLRDAAWGTVWNQLRTQVAIRVHNQDDYHNVFHQVVGDQIWNQLGAHVWWQHKEQSNHD
jgi:hypothetical protein